MHPDYFSGENMRNYKELIALVVVVVGLVVTAKFMDKLAPPPLHDSANSETKNSEPSDRTPALTPIAPRNPGEEHQTGTPEKKLQRFEALNKKVLLSKEAAVEREYLLSDLKTIDSVGATLIEAAPVSSSPERLRLIDYLENAVVWSENPAREESLATIVQVIRSEKFRSASKAEQREAVGDKIELFTILRQNAPTRAERLLEETKGTTIEPILQFAAKRLPVNGPISEK